MEKKEVIGYKVFNPDWKCRGFQYQVGKCYQHEGKVGVCKNGFHFCESLVECFNYYSFDPNNKVAKIVASGEIKSNGGKSVCSHIEILSELAWQEVLLLANVGKNNSGYRNSGDWNSGDGNSGDKNSGYSNSGYSNSGNWNSGDKNSGNWNSGDWNSGLFNTKKSTISVFNIDSGLTMEEFKNKLFPLPSCLYFDLTEWVQFSVMTDNEKWSHPNADACGGYLKSIPYQEASKKSIGNAPESEKAQIRELPNYDPDIFEEIFGIRI